MHSLMLGYYYCVDCKFCVFYCNVKISKILIWADVSNESINM